MRQELKKETKVKNFDSVQNYQTLLALSLLDYAKIDRYFAQAMYGKLAGMDLSQKTAHSPKIDSEFLKYLIPSSTDMALRRLDYILAEYADAESVIAPLHGWAKSFEDESPKNIVVGLVGMAIPGPTMGMIKKRYSMNFLLSGYNKIGKKDLVKKSLDASFDIVAANIKNKKGDTNRLEPELYDWLFGDREISFYEASFDKLEEIKSQIKKAGLSFKEVKNNDNFKALVLSPVVDREYFSDLQKIDLQ